MCVTGSCQSQKDFRSPDTGVTGGFCESPCRVLEIELTSFARETSAFNHRAISQVPFFSLLDLVTNLSQLWIAIKSISEPDFYTVELKEPVLSQSPGYSDIFGYCVPGQAPATLSEEGYEGYSVGCS